MRPVVAVLGGGAFVPKLCVALALEPGVPPLDVRLFARRRDRLELIAGHARRRLAASGAAVHVEACSSLERAVDGAQAVVLLIRAGGLAARAHDEQFPRAFGLVGDEGLGVGGIANAFRTVPLLIEVARVLLERAPGARVLDLMAPLGITTRLLLDAGLDAIGACELPRTTLDALARSAGAAPADVRSRYGGLNHVGWFWDLAADPPAEVDVLAAAVRADLVDADTARRFGAAPLRYYASVFQAPPRLPPSSRRGTHTPGIEAVAGSPRLPLGLPSAPSNDPASRALRLAALSERLVEHYGEAARRGTPAAEDPPELAERPTPWFDRAVAPMLGALLGGPPHRGFANVRNRALLPELPADAVVEVAATLDERGVHAVPPGSLPPPVATFLAALARSEELAYLGACGQDPALVREAIRALPLPIEEADVPRLARLACQPL